MRLGRVSIDARTVDRRKTSRSQSGMTLLEVIAAVFVTSTAVVAVVAAVLTIFFSAASHRQSVRAGVEATNVAEKMDRATYVPCATPSSYNAGLSAVDGYVPSVTKVEYLVSKTAANATYTTAPCTDDQGAQRITVSVTNVDRVTVTETVVYVKRDNRCSGAALGVEC